MALFQNSAVVHLVMPGYSLADDNSHSVFLWMREDQRDTCLRFRWGLYSTAHSIEQKNRRYEHTPVTMKDFRSCQTQEQRVGAFPGSEHAVNHFL